MNRVQIGSVVLAAIIAVGAVVLGGEDIGTAIQIAFDDVAAKEYCGRILDENVGE